jgi:hypothetical protein
MVRFTITVVGLDIGVDEALATSVSQVFLSGQGPIAENH